MIVLRCLTPYNNMKNVEAKKELKSILENTDSIAEKYRGGTAYGKIEKEQMRKDFQAIFSESENLRKQFDNVFDEMPDNFSNLTMSVHDYASSVGRIAALVDTQVK